MKLHLVDVKEFFSSIENVKWQVLDTQEAMFLGYKSCYDAFIKADRRWGKYYLVKSKKEVLVAIIVQRDGEVIYFTTQSLPGSNMRRYIRIMRSLSDSILRRCGPTTVTAAPWYADAARFLEIVGYRIYRKTPTFYSWVKDGK